MSRIIQAHGRSFHVGGLLPSKETAESHPHLFRALKDFTEPGFCWPTPPDTLDYWKCAPEGESDILGNDKYGDCAIAMILHWLEYISAAAGNPVKFTLADAIALYGSVTGFDVNDPSTDQGTDLISLLKYMVTTGYKGHKIVGWVALDSGDWAQLRACAWLFGNLNGVPLPNSYVNPPPSGSGFVWGTGTPNPENGHAFPSVGVDKSDLPINTWAMRGLWTRAAIKELGATRNGGQIFAALTEDSINRATKIAGSGVDFDTLRAAMRNLGAQIAA